VTDAYDVLRLVAEATGQSPGRICGGFQTHADAEARHLCWYLCHTALGMRQIDIGNWFGVERRAIGYGIARIEDKRDSPAFDERLTSIERNLTS
jgi:chromosomal replication initiation ATPase DnaA